MRQRLNIILPLLILLAFTTYAQIPDSLNQKINEINHAIDSSRLKITSKIDSIANFKPNTDSLQKLNPLNDVNNQINKATQKLNGVESKINGRVKSVEDKLNGNLNKFNENGGKLGQLNSPDLNGKINTGVKLPGAGMATMNNPLGSFNTNIKTPNIQSPNFKTPTFNNPYASKISALSNADAEKQITSKLTSLADVKEFEKETGPTAEMIKKWNSDPDVAKEMALNKAKEQAVNYFAGHEQQLKSTMNNLSKVKSKYKDAEGVVDLFKKPTNPMKGKPLIERLVPAINMQFQFSANQWYDFNPAIGYRWSGRFTSGLGWMERVATNIKRREFVNQDRAYGPRIYAEFQVKSGFSVRTEVEYINAFVSTSFMQARGEIPSRDWRWSGFAGIKKSFSFSKRVKGNVQMLYNIYDPHKMSPYGSRLAIRIGFEFPMKKSSTDAGNSPRQH